MSILRRFLLMWVLLGLIGPALAQDQAASATPRNPLTGLPVNDPAVLERRPLIVKIINAPAEVRPQAGLMAADHVWEHLLAGGITRFSAVYLSQTPERVGPIRSARLVDIALTKIYDGLFTYSGMSTGTLDRVRADALMPSRLVGGTSPCPALCRDALEVNEKLEYSLYGSVPALRDLAAELGRDVRPPDNIASLTFSELTPEGGDSVNSVTVRYVNTRVVWAWDAGNGVWLRSQDGEPHRDATTEQIINAENVVILEDDHVEMPYTADQYWGPPNYAFNVPLLGEGRAIFLRDGRYYEGRWQRDNANGPLRYVLSNGQPFAFKPGRTFFNLVPRWVNGYELAFDRPEPLTATVNVTSANLRWGPTTSYSVAGAAFQGDTLDAIGRDANGDWLQIRHEGALKWVAASVVDAPGRMALPLVRPTIE